MLENELINVQMGIESNWKSMKKILAYRFEGRGGDPARKRRALFEGWETRWISTLENVAVQNFRLRERREELKRLLGLPKAGNRRNV